MIKKINIKHVRTGDVCVNKRTGETITIHNIIPNRREGAIVVYSQLGVDRIKRWMYLSDLIGGKLFRKSEWEIY